MMGAGRADVSASESVRVRGPLRLRLLEVLERLFLQSLLERLVARFVLFSRGAEVLPLCLRLLHLRQELLLDLDGGRRLDCEDRGRDREEQRESDSLEKTSHVHLPVVSERL